MHGFETATFRAARPDDAHAIADLHAASWRRHYRGAYADAFLDGDVVQDRRGVWTERFSATRPAAITFVAETPQQHLVGFAHTILDEDATWGALLDNLHVAHTHARQGIGSRLLRLSVAALTERRSGSPLHLWVLEQNVSAQAFYRAHGGRCVERTTVLQPGGDPTRLNGSPIKLRFAWPG